MNSRDKSTTEKQSFGQILLLTQFTDTLLEGPTLVETRVIL